MKHRLQPTLPLPLSATEIEQLRTRFRASVIVLTTVVLMITSYLIWQFGFPFSVNNPFEFAFVVVVGLFAAIVWQETMRFAWNLYAPLRKERHWYANYLFERRPEHLAYKQAVIEMRRPFVLHDLRQVDRYAADMSLWDMDERKRTQDELEVQKLYAGTAGR